MPNKIQNRYAALQRELELQGTPDSFELHSDVRGVVILHEHCEGAHQSAAATQGGIAGPVGGVVTVQPRRAGAHQIILFWNSYVAVAAQEAARFLLVDSTTSQTAGGLWYFDFGRGGMERGTLVIPKMHIPENTYVSGDLLTGILAADFITMGITIQPV